TVMLDGETFEVAPPALIIVPPLTVHSFVFSTDVDGFVLTFFAQDVKTALGEIGPAADSLLRPRILKPIEAIVDAPELEQAVKRLVAEADRGAPGQVAALRARLSLLL